MTQANSVKVYRLWDKDHSQSEHGRWWSLTKPGGSIEVIRQQYDICRTYKGKEHKLNRLTACYVKVGAHFAMGPGQSMKCDDDPKPDPKSTVNQVYIGDMMGMSEGTIPVENCSPPESFCEAPC